MSVSERSHRSSVSSIFSKQSVAQEPSEDSESNEDSDDEEIPQLFQENVVKYVKIDDMIKKKQAEIRELRKLLKPCEVVILEFLQENKQEMVVITEGKLKSNTTETKAPLTQTIIREALTRKVNNEELIEEILLLMDELRVKRVKVNLKRQADKKKKTT